MIYIGAKTIQLVRIMFNKVNGFIRDHHGTKYLMLFGPEKYDAIFDNIRYLIKLKSSITYVDSLNYSKVKIVSDDDFPLGKILTMRNVIILITLAFDKNHNQHY